jgi:hypothetical protein
MLTTLGRNQDSVTWSASIAATVSRPSRTTWTISASGNAATRASAQ